MNKRVIWSLLILAVAVLVMIFTRGSVSLNLLVDHIRMATSVALLIFMALGGYDPHAAIEVWQKMAASGSGGGPPVFLSTHPTDQQRINQIRKWLPEAMTYYRQ